MDTVDLMMRLGIDVSTECIWQHSTISLLRKRTKHNVLFPSLLSYRRSLFLSLLFLPLYSSSPSSSCCCHWHFSSLLLILIFIFLLLLLIYCYYSLYSVGKWDGKCSPHDKSLWKMWKYQHRTGNIGRKKGRKGEEWGVMGVQWKRVKWSWQGRRERGWERESKRYIEWEGRKWGQTVNKIKEREGREVYIVREREVGE